METLPPRQAALLDYLRSYQRECGVGAAPSIREVCAEFGFSSPNAAAELLAKLEAKGAITREPGAHRSIRILWPDPAAVAANDLRPPHQIPLLGRIAAGTPITAGIDVAEGASAFLDFDPVAFDVIPDFLHEVDGYSMINVGILPGDKVGTKRQESVTNRKIVTAVVIDPVTGDPTLTIKRYEKRGSIITLRSENDDQETYKPQVYDTRRDEIQILGIYCGLIRTRVQ